MTRVNLTKALNGMNPNPTTGGVATSCAQPCPIAAHPATELHTLQSAIATLALMAQHSSTCRPARRIINDAAALDLVHTCSSLARISRSALLVDSVHTQLHGSRSAQVDVMVSGVPCVAVLRAPAGGAEPDLDQAELLALCPRDSATDILPLMDPLARETATLTAIHAMGSPATARPAYG